MKRPGPVFLRVAGFALLLMGVAIGDFEITVYGGFVTTWSALESIERKVTK